MPDHPVKPQLSVIDFSIPLLTKVPVVLLSEFLLPSVVLGAIFFGLRLFGLLSVSIYFGWASFALIFGFCIFAALRFNSVGFVRRLYAERRTNPVFRIPHPVVEDLKDGEPLLTRVKKLCAISLLETKAYTIAYGAVFITFYFFFLYFLRDYDRTALVCARSCEVFLFGVKSIGSGVLFDFFDAFHIELSDVANGSKYFLAVAFLAKLVFTGLVVRVVTLYFTFRKRFRSALRTSAMAFDETRLSDVHRTVDQTILGPRGIYFFLPPWLRPSKKGPEAK